MKKKHKWLRYLYGYVAGMECCVKSVGELLYEEKKYHRHNPRSPWWCTMEAVVFETRDEAEKAARKHGYTYTRGYVYETDNPEAANGCKLISESDDVGITYLK